MQHYVDHKLRSSASPVLTATAFVDGKGQFSTPPPTESTPLNRSPKNLSLVITLATPTPRHSDIRTKLKQEIQHIWTDSVRNGSPRWSVTLLLAPSTVIVFTKAQRRAVLASTFEFIQQSGCHL